MARSRRDDDDDEDDKPRKKTRRPADDEDEDDEPVRPSAKKKPAKPIDDDEDDEDEEDDTPPPKKKRVVRARDDDDAPMPKPKRNKKKSGIPKPLLIGGIIAALVLFCGCGGALGIYFLGGSDSPKSAFVAFQKDAGDSKWDGVWDRMDKASQDDYAKDPGRRYPGKFGKEVFVAKINDPLTGDFEKLNFLWIAAGKIESVEQTGDSATVTVKLVVLKGPFGGMGPLDAKPYRMIKEGGKWKVNVKDSMK